MPFGLSNSPATFESLIELVLRGLQWMKYFATTAAPLTELTRKNAIFLWTETYAVSFEKLKEQLTSAPVLAYLEGKGEFVLDTDASASAMGAVLSQVQNGEERVVAYGSKTFGPTQRREPEGMLARWIAYLGTFDMKIEHLAERLHANADGLSRKPGCHACKRLDCPECQKPSIKRVKWARRRVPRAQVQPQVSSSKMKMRLPVTRARHRYVFVACDYFTKWAEAYALPDQTARTTADCLVSQQFTRFGCPRQLHSYQGRNFELRLFAEVCDLLEIQKTRTTPYHPQSDGLVERLNRTILDMLAKVDWDEHLPYVMAAYRGTPQENTGVSPNLMMFCREVGSPVELMFDPLLGPDSPRYPVEYVELIRRVMRAAHEHARQQLGKTAERQKRNYDKRVLSATLQPGTWVWRYYTPNAGKLGNPWQGPLLVTKENGDHAPARWKIPDQNPEETDDPTNATSIRGGIGKAASGPAQIVDNRNHETDTSRGSEKKSGSEEEKQSGERDSDVLSLQKKPVCDIPSGTYVDVTAGSEAASSHG
ncbi:PREDICTED: uncharacterized protein K02A2.6-like [Priapulus caudatus]|uniref:Uncharacterized protein K02A2.6-like n=1 Tax=Priapulus caudatus TaxID=37621 RepID=A0ABM1ESL1_PRICU|nr:PREDICTED: uncharacterized protein K02A2.6-like [Priapulus caudatus]